MMNIYINYIRKKLKNKRFSIEFMFDYSYTNLHNYIKIILLM